jgi:predicted amidohydrolase
LYPSPGNITPLQRHDSPPFCSHASGLSSRQGKSEAPAYDIARRAARDSGRFLMTHHAISTIGLEKCPGEMQPGDIYTHMYHGWPSTILQVSPKIWL